MTGRILNQKEIFFSNFTYTFFFVFSRKNDPLAAQRIMDPIDIMIPVTRIRHFHLEVKMWSQLYSMKAVPPVKAAHMSEIGMILVPTNAYLISKYARALV